MPPYCVVLLLSGMGVDLLLPVLSVIFLLRPADSSHGRARRRPHFRRERSLGSVQCAQRSSLPLLTRSNLLLFRLTTLAAETHHATPVRISSNGIIPFAASLRKDVVSSLPLQLPSLNEDGSRRGSEAAQNEFDIDVIRTRHLKRNCCTFQVPLKVASTLFFAVVRRNFAQRLSKVI